MTKLDLLTDADLKREPKPKKAPPKRWRNLWYLPPGAWGKDIATGERVVGPRQSWGRTIYPTKDLAETAARAVLPNNKLVRWLGAHPLDTDPEL